MRDMPVMTGHRPDDWVATCGVCDECFAVRASDSPSSPAPHGSFCPDCRARGKIAPGVLHWHRRSEAAEALEYDDLAEANRRKA